MAYDPDTSTFEGQRSWKDALAADLAIINVAVHRDGFQAAWKKFTGIPADGNSNPNWKDCQMYLEAVIANIPGVLDVAVPDMPYMYGLKFNRKALTRDQWHMMLLIAKLYGYLAKNLTRRPKWAGPRGGGGWLGYIVNNGYLHIGDTGFAHLAELCRNYADNHGFNVDDKEPKQEPSLTF